MLLGWLQTYLLVLSASCACLAHPKALPKPRPANPNSDLQGSNPPSIPSRMAHIVPYDVKLPAFPKTYSAAEKQAQTKAGTKLLADLSNVFKQHLNGTSKGKALHTVAPGVYRISSRIDIDDVVDLKLVMANVEIITTTTEASIWIYGGNNLEIAGPIRIDADPIPESQGTIVGTDGKSYVDIKTMPGYRIPNMGSILKCFTKDGIMAPHYQDSIALVTDRGNDVWRVTTPDTAATFQDFPCLRGMGNYFASEGNKTTGSGGVNLQGVGNLYWHDVYHHAPALIFGQNTKGTLRFDRWMGQRRPGTNRLGSGEWIQCQFDGGSMDMTNSEISHNYDDLTDLLGGYLSAALAGRTANQLYVNAAHMEKGRTFKFYDATDLTELGTATITKVDTEKVIDQSVLDQAAAKAKAASIRDGWVSSAGLVTLDRPITGHSGFYLADDQQARPKLLSIRNSYFHDNLASGIQLNGANRILATGNVIERVAIAALTSAASAYWLEGGVSRNVNFARNYIKNTPYSIDMKGPAIRVSTDGNALQHAKNEALHHNVNVVDNTIINPKLGGVAVAVANKVTIGGNKIYNPASVHPTNADDLQPYGYSPQTCQNAVLRNNAAYVTNSTSGFSADFFLVANNRTSIESVTVGYNVLAANGAKRVQARLGDLDDSLW